MKTFRQFEDSVASKNFKNIYSIIGKHEVEGTYVNDAPATEIQLTSSEIKSIQDSMWDEVKTNTVTDGQPLVTLNEYKENAVIAAKKRLQNYVSNGSVEDGFYNPLSGQGVSGYDPGTYNMAFTPVSMSPYEATSYYSSGGLPQIIVDKKANGALLNGYHFESTKMSEEDRNTLKEYAQSINFDSALKTGNRDGLVYGGALLYPTFKNDNPITFNMTLEQLIQSKTIAKNCIDYFVTVDRWNTVMVPDYNLTAKDYLSPDSYFIPIGGIRVSSSRCAVIRPKPLPYWGAIRQLGWGISDYEGYIKSLISYNIIIASVPIMAQQMSLLIHEIPLDGMIAQNGIDTAQEFVTANQAVMRNWTMLDPVAINSYGKISVVERNYSGYEPLILSLRHDVAANSEIPESSLFYTASTGFADTESDTVLKQSEAIKKINNNILPSLQPLVKILVYSCFGPDSPQAKLADTVRLSFESPVVVSDEEKGKLLEKVGNAVNALTLSGIQVGDALALTRAFVPNMQLSEEVVARINAIPSPQEQKDKELAAAKTASKQTGAKKKTDSVKKHEKGITDSVYTEDAEDESLMTRIVTFIKKVTHA